MRTRKRAVALTRLLPFAVALAAGFGALPARGDTNFFDGTFPDANWHSTKIVDTTAGAAATFTAMQSVTGGNPGSFRIVNHSYNTGTMIVAHLLDGATYTPSAQGAISVINFSYDFREFNPPFGGAQVAYGLLLKQNGSYFILYEAFGSTSWISILHTNLTAFDFSNLLVDGSLGAQHPDFSTNGSPIAFGYFTGNSSIAGGVNTQSGIDNYSVTVIPVGNALPATLGIDLYAGIQVTGTIGATYQLQYAPSTAPSNWTALTNIVLPYSPYLYFDLKPVTGQGRRFYRALTLQ